MTRDSHNICDICNAADILYSDEHVLVLRRPYGGVIAPRRHIARWRDLYSSEQVVLTSWIAHVQDKFDPNENSNVVFSEDGPHMHLRIYKPWSGNSHLPVLPHDRPLITGGEDELQRHLVPYIDAAKSIDLTVSFLMRSGVVMIRPHLQDMLERGGRIRLLTGDYLDVTEPEALRLVNDMDGDVSTHVFQAQAIPFHPKAWIFRFGDETGALLVGSSNLSKSALTTGIEWNLRLFDHDTAVPLVKATSAFEALLSHSEVTELTEEWISTYESRRPPDRRSVSGIPREPSDPPPEPNEIQVEALAALNATRSQGYRAGLVVLATGLGKTYLAAFDSLEFNRILFVAHREEILSQAMETFRKLHPNAHLGKFTGKEKDTDARILFGSVQTLTQASHLDRFEKNAFDYIVVDEFHHAAATSYRRIIEHFHPSFLLGLTATPDRADGGDLLGLCGENIVYECDLRKGIDSKQLAPFKYYGIADLIEYAQIPWRNGRFDEEALTNALATKARAKNTLEQLNKHGQQRAIGFCVSQRHADFMAQFANDNGFKAVAVHSGRNSARRTTSLKALERGELDIVFAVDMFNEGVDVPSVDTVLMLRPTESPVIWLQQLGRGLRRAPGKAHLAVIDYIGNHRSFLTPARALLQTDIGDKALRSALEIYSTGNLRLPEGCEVTYDLEALDILKSLIRRTRVKEEMEELKTFYRDFRDRHGERPTASQMQRAGFRPAQSKKRSWFGIVNDMDDLTDPDLHNAFRQHKALFAELEKTAMNRSYKMLVLRAMLEAGKFPGSISLNELANRIANYATSNPTLSDDISVNTNDIDKTRSLLKREPLRAWNKTKWFVFENDEFRTDFELLGVNRHALTRLVSELVEWRITRYLLKKHEKTNSAKP